MRLNGIRYSAPQKRNDCPRSIIRMHAGATKLGNPRPEMAQPIQIEFRFRVKAVCCARSGACQNPVGANHLVVSGIAHEDMNAVRVEDINVEALFRCRQACATFICEYPPTKPLGFLHL